MIDFIVNYWDTIFAIIGIAGTTCTAIVKAFSGQKWAQTIVNICDKLSVVNTETNKEILKKYAKKNK